MRNYIVKKRVFIIINQNIQENLFTARPPFGQKIVPIFLPAKKPPHSVPKGKIKFFQGILCEFKS
jgi:hypothetical protein